MSGDVPKPIGCSVTRYFGRNKKSPYGSARELRIQFSALPKLLGMEDGVGEKLLKDIVWLEETYMDIKITPGSQMVSLRVIEDKLSQLHPGIYELKEEGEKRMYSTLRVIFERHHKRRCQERRSNLNRQKERARERKINQLSKTNSNHKHQIQPANQANSTVPKTRSMEGKIFYIGIPRRNRSVVQSTRHGVIAPRSLSASARMHLRLPVYLNTPQHVHMSPENMISDSQLVAFRASSSRKDEGLATPRSSNVNHYPLAQIHEAMDAPSERTSNIENYHTTTTPKHSSTQFYDVGAADFPSLTSSPSSSGNIAAVHRFLSTCQPPMTAYLRRFLEFGCISGEYLRGVAGWCPSQRNKLLKTILRNESEMDVAVLDHQFETYFLSRS